MLRDILKESQTDKLSDCHKDTKTDKDSVFRKTSRHRDIMKDRHTGRQTF